MCRLRLLRQRVPSTSSASACAPRLRNQTKLKTWEKGTRVLLFTAFYLSYSCSPVAAAVAAAVAARVPYLLLGTTPPVSSSPVVMYKTSLFSSPLPSPSSTSCSSGGRFAIA